MKLGQIAAVTLAGWYLMLPPFIHNMATPDSPLSLWTTYQSFDLAEGYESIKSAMQDFAEKDISRQHPISAEMDDAVKYAQCIASDDPRLKNK